MLAQADVRGQSVAQTPGRRRVGRVAALAHVRVDGLGRAAVADAPVGLAEGSTQIAEIAAPGSCGMDVVLGCRLRELGEFEGKAGRRGLGIVAYAQGLIG